MLPPRAFLPPLLLLVLLLQLPFDAGAQKQCIDMSAPKHPDAAPSFCKEYTVESCCTKEQDGQRRGRWLFHLGAEDKNSACAEVMRRLVCAVCDPYASSIFGVVSNGGRPRAAPYLCTRSPYGGGLPFCATVWLACQNVSLYQNPFVPPSKYAPLLANEGMPTKLSVIYPTKEKFCFDYTSPNGAETNEAPEVCYKGVPLATIPADPNLPSPGAMCVEKIGDSEGSNDNGGYVAMVPHPDRSNRAFFVKRTGQIYLVDLPTQDSGYSMSRSSTPFLDLSSKVAEGPEMGVLGLAFHPDFLNNGRFFVSYVCDSVKETTCAVSSRECACNDVVGCSAATINDYMDKAGGKYGTTPCRNVSVVDEFTVFDPKAWIPPTPASATVAQAKVQRRVLKIGQPFNNNNGGQIRFGPLDRFMYIMLGDGGGDGDPFNLATNPNSPLGKILRVDVDGGIPSAGEMEVQGLLGAYAVPNNNPFASEDGVRRSVWASGFRNPWKCAFDTLRPTLLLCGDWGQDGLAEEVDVITAGGNYGWRKYDGNQAAPLNKTLSTKTVDLTGVQFQWPIITYPTTTNGSVIGGVFVRGSLNPCLYGRYVFADSVQGLFVDQENPPFSGNFSGTPTRLTVNCAPDSPEKCVDSDTIPAPVTGTVNSLGIDRNQTVYILAEGGVWRMVAPSRCNKQCTEALPSPPPAPPPPGTPLPLITGGVTPPATLGGATPPPVATGASPIGTGSPSGTSTTTTSGTPSGTSTTSNTSSSTTSSSSSSSGGGPTVQDTSYYVKLGLILGSIVLIVIAICCFCLIRGYREGKKKDERFLELQEAEEETLNQIQDDHDDDEEDELYDPEVGGAAGGRGGAYDDATTVTDEDATTIHDDAMTESDETMTEYSARRSERGGGGGRGGGYEESLADTEYTGYDEGTAARSVASYDQQSARGGGRGDHMSDARSYTTRDDFTDTGSAYGYAPR